MSIPFPPEPLAMLAKEVAALLRERKESVSVAETAAGGLISSAILATPGASAIYKGGLTLYTLESRVQFAGWTQADIDNYQGPSPEIVERLAQNVRQRLGSTYTICEVSKFILQAGKNTWKADKRRWEERDSRAYGWRNKEPFAVIMCPVLCLLAQIAKSPDRGYVALAVATKDQSISRERDTGLGGDRTGNMVSFACEALTLLKEVISAESKL